MTEVKELVEAAKDTLGGWQGEVSNTYEAADLMYKHDILIALTLIVDALQSIRRKIKL